MAMNKKIMEKLVILEAMARDSNLLESPFVRNSLQWLSIRWNNVMANKLYGYLLNQVDGNYFIKDVFSLPCNQDELVGELVLGNVIGREEIELRYSTDVLPQHILVAGFAGSGKSNFGKVLIEQAYRIGIRSIKISDPKKEYNHIAMKYPDFLLLNWNELRFNLFRPPPNVPEDEWDQIIVGHLSECFNFWDQAKSLFLKLISIERRKGICPTIYSLLRNVKDLQHRFYYKDLVTQSTVASRLELLTHVFGNLISTETEMLPLLTNHHYVLQTAGLMSEIESWLLEVLLLWEFYYRISNPDKRDLALHVYDEAQHRIFSSEKERNIRKIGASLISMMVDEIRAMNMGICSMSQEPSTLVNAVLNNSYLKVCFHLGSGKEIQVMKEAMGLTDDQTELLHTIETGEGIVRIAGGFMDPFPVKFQQFDEPRCVDMAEFKHHQTEMKRGLWKKAGISGKDSDENIYRDMADETGLYNEEYDILDEQEQDQEK
jgi:hypothetical protein